LSTIAHTIGATGIGAQVSMLFGETYICGGVCGYDIAGIISKTISATYWRGLVGMIKSQDTISFNRQDEIISCQQPCCWQLDETPSSPKLALPWLSTIAKS
jgi:hypothetical protein